VVYLKGTTAALAKSASIRTENQTGFFTNSKQGTNYSPFPEQKHLSNKLA
jgi:hypothetical protein